jgi:glycerol kinase
MTQMRFGLLKLVALQKLSQNRDLREIAAIGSPINAKQQSSRETSKPLYNAIVWQDRRTAKYCDKLKQRAAEMIQKKTGLVLDAYFSGTKLKWILDNRRRTKKQNKESFWDRGHLVNLEINSR